MRKTPAAESRPAPVRHRRERQQSEPPSQPDERLLALARALGRQAARELWQQARQISYTSRHAKEGSHPETRER
ncbi:MAG TPA: hypothetical protein VD970_17740, partial [Acetobacteraceae bacterium]|nr:hypothetical protein [Acetobacteraceae bacterium]